MRCMAARIGLCAATLWMSPGSAQQTFSGTQVESGCRTLVTLAVNNGYGRTREEAVYAGECAGIVSVLLTAGSSLDEKIRLCAPREANVMQGARVVLKYLGNHPKHLHLSAVDLAMAAFREAWPCPRAN